MGDMTVRDVRRSLADYEQDAPCMLTVLPPTAWFRYREALRAKRRMVAELQGMGQAADPWDDCQEIPIDKAAAFTPAEAWRIFLNTELVEGDG